MNCILEHVVDEVWIWLDEIIQGAQNLQVLSLFLMEQIETNFVLVELHFVYGRFQLVSLVLDHLFPLLDLLFLFLELFDLLVNLLLHHLKQVLMLNFELVHDPPETLLKLVDLLVELLPDFHFELVVKFFVDRDGAVVLINFNDHFLDHLFHFFDLWRYLDNLVLYISVLQNTFGAEHRFIIFAVELYFFRRMNVAIPDGRILDTVWVICVCCGRGRNTHWQSR